jgi:hypothetical protein
LDGLIVGSIACTELLVYSIPQLIEVDLNISSSSVRHLSSRLRSDCPDFSHKSELDQEQNSSEQQRCTDSDESSLRHPFPRISVFQPEGGRNEGYAS